MAGSGGGSHDGRMRKLVPLICLASLLAAPLAAVPMTAAIARDYGRGYGRGDGFQGGGDFREMLVEDRGGRDGGRREGGGREAGATRAPRADPRYREAPGSRAPQDRMPQERMPQGGIGRAFPYAPPEARGGYRRGDYLPDTYRNTPAPDPGRLHLRAPPYGYAWVQVGPDVLLMQQSTGRILDSVPAGDAPPPRIRRR